MEERTLKTIKKTVVFEKSGETLSIEIGMENVSPRENREAVLGVIDTLYHEAKREVLTGGILQ